MELYDSGSTADLNRLADACVALLQKNRLTVTTAESCTGGIRKATSPIQTKRSVAS